MDIKKLKIKTQSGKELEEATIRKYELVFKAMNSLNIALKYLKQI